MENNIIYCKINVNSDISNRKPNNRLRRMTLKLHKTVCKFNQTWLIGILVRFNSFEYRYYRYSFMGHKNIWCYHSVWMIWICGAAIFSVDIVHMLVSCILVHPGFGYPFCQYFHLSFGLLLFIIALERVSLTIRMKNSSCCNSVAGHQMATMFCTCENFLAITELE